ncbi:MAG: HAD family hydrolase [Oscillospiraceae bacterium]|nr:HAD family hydrolase [Oscillospiraceae bacterium]
MACQAVLFDMDGTVLDTLDDLTNAVNASLRHFSLPPVSRETVRQSLGNGAKYLIEHCVPEGVSEEDRDRILTWYKPWYDAHCRIETRPYPGILPMMERLKAKGLRLAIISNKPDPAVQELAAAFFPGLLETAVGERASVRRKPSPDAVLTAAAEMGVSVSDCVYVGDSEVDIQTARNAGMDCLSVCWGFRDPDQLAEAGAAHPVYTPEELEERILNL